MSLQATLMYIWRSKRKSIELER